MAQTTYIKPVMIIALLTYGAYGIALSTYMTSIVLLTSVLSTSNDFHENWWKGVEWAKEEPIKLWHRTKFFPLLISVFKCGGFASVT